MQWHQLDHMQTICTSLQTDNHTNTPSLNCYRPDALPDAQPTLATSTQYRSCQSTSAAWTGAQQQTSRTLLLRDLPGSLGHRVNGSFWFGHLSRPGHQVTILTRCETRVFPVFEKNAQNAKRRTFEMLK